MKANDMQVGGFHYRQEDGGEQHWDRVWRLYGSGYFVGCITKYIERYPVKNGVEDLEKARHFLTKLIELETADKVRLDAKSESILNRTLDDPEDPLPTGYVDQDY